jgi:hypothetical protein
LKDELHGIKTVVFSVQGTAAASFFTCKKDTANGPVHAPKLTNSFISKNNKIPVNKILPHFVG